MSRILVLYGTTDGQTAKIARFVADELRVLGDGADLIEAHSPDIPDPRDYTGIIVLASVHISSYQKAVRRWVTRHAAELSDKPAMFISVCLGVLQKDEEARRDLAGILERFLAQTHWRPTLARHVPGALLYTRYNWLKRWVMRRIAAKAGGVTDTSRDVEYTDWEELRALVRQFHSRMRPEEQGTRSSAPAVKTVSVSVTM